MLRAKTPSFVCELPLRMTPADERELLVRLDCARMVYNACLGACLKRLRLMHASEDYQAARQLPRHSAARKASFAAAREQFGFREYDLHAYAVQFSHSWLGEHLDSNTIQKIATRAFLAAQRYAFGQNGKPRFKGKGWFDSVEGKTNTSGILWREGRVRWLGLELPALIDPQDEVIAYSLSRPVKFVRLVRRKLGGCYRFYAQLVCEGQSYRKEKNKIGKGVVGLDIGPSTIAVVSQSGEAARLERFCDEVKPQQKAIRKLQRKLDRQRRANNPQNYHPDGTAKKGVNKWYFSQRYVYTRKQLAEVHRKQAAYRRSLHGRMVNRILAQGDTLKLERLSYRAFQRRFGKSVRFRGPGAFVHHLKRKAENAGVEIDEFAPGPTRLSQTCLCGSIAQKLLSQRWHFCDCGVGPVQRDLFSAWLATFVEDGRLGADQAHAAWPGVDARLRAASSVIQSAMGQGNPPNPATGQSRSSAKSGGRFGEAHANTLHVSDERAGLQARTPGFSYGEPSA